jgi:diacylglycerol kinase (ATP)
MPAKVILNPYSNRWKARERWGEAQLALNAAGVEFEMTQTESPGHATDIAASAIEAGYSPIIVAGGDGTIGEVVNGLARVEGDGPWGPLGILPLGTANDLAYALDLPLDLNAAAHVIANGKTRVMDVGNVNGKYFANNSASGIEPYVTTIQEKITGVKGILRYLIAALRGINDNPTWSVEMEWDNGQYEGPVTLVTVGNGSRSGGIFYMIPHADLFDGKLTVVYGFVKGKLGLLNLLPRTMKSGKGSYIEDNNIKEFTTTHMKLHFTTPTPAHADGELFQNYLQDLDYQILASRLKIIIP